MSIMPVSVTFCLSTPALGFHQSCTVQNIIRERYMCLLLDWIGEWEKHDNIRKSKDSLS